MRISDWSSDVCSSDLGKVSRNEDSCSIRQPRNSPARRRKASDVLGALGKSARDSGDVATVPISVDNNSRLFADSLRQRNLRSLDRKSVVKGQSASVRVDLGGRRIIKKQKIKQE